MFYIYIIITITSDRGPQFSTAMQFLIWTINIRKKKSGPLILDWTNIIKNHIFYIKTISTTDFRLDGCN
jgi:hypothetical protein